MLRAIQAQWADHVQGGLASDVDVAVRQFADDVILIEPGAEPVVGLEAFRDMERRIFADQETAGITKLSRDRQVVALRVFGDVAYEIGTNRVRNRTRSGQETTQLFHYMVSWSRQADGTWKVHRMVVDGAPLP